MDEAPTGATTWSGQLRGADAGVKGCGGFGLGGVGKDALPSKDVWFLHARFESLPDSVREWLGNSVLWNGLCGGISRLVLRAAMVSKARMVEPE